jgi:hypothetical protein
MPQMGRYIQAKVRMQVRFPTVYKDFVHLNNVSFAIIGEMNYITLQKVGPRFLYQTS